MFSDIDFIFNSYQTADDYIHAAEVYGYDVNIKEVKKMIEHPKSVTGKCCLLVRVSTEGQDLVQQTEKVKAEALKDGFSEENIIVIEDKESAVKLSEEERNGLNKLKHHIEHDNITCVYTYEVSRISRQPAMLYNVRDYLIKHNVQLIILNPYMKMLKEDGTLSETANIFFSIFAGMAENEGYLRKQRCKRGMEKKKSLGLYVGGNVPTGYKVKDDKFIIDKNGSEIVRRIFNSYVEGKSIREIGKELINEGLWAKDINCGSMRQNILNIIHREYYCGDDMHPAIITRELYDAVQKKCKNKTFYSKGNKDTALFRGMIKDNNGKTLTTNIVNKFYFTKGTTISFKITDSFMWGLAREWYSQIYNYKKQEIINKLNYNITQQQNIVRTMSDKISANQDRIDRIEERYIDGKISKERADQLESKAFYELQSYKRTLDNAKAEIERLNDMISNGTNMIMISDDMTIEDKRTVIKFVVEKIRLYKQSYYVAEVEMVNKITGEQRTMLIHTRKMEIMKISVKMRPGLNYKS